MPDPALITVIVPAYNAEPYIAETLRSVLAQTWRQLEVLVVDDGSTDGTLAAARAIAAEDARVRVLTQSNAGVGAARNRAIAEARGSFVAPIDADDLWAPQKLELQMAQMERHGLSTSMVYCWSTKIDEHGHRYALGFAATSEGQIVQPLFLRHILGNASSPLFRRSALLQVGEGPYLTRAQQGGAQGCEDWDLHLRLAEIGDVRVVPQFLVGYRQSRGCLSGHVNGMERSYRIAMKRALARNPNLPRALVRWAAGHFYVYLASKSYLSGHYGGCLRSVLTAMSWDSLHLLNRKLYHLAAGSIIHGLTRSRLRRDFRAVVSYDPNRRERFDPTPPSPGFTNSIVDRVQQKRWEAVTGKPSPGAIWLQTLSRVTGI